MKLTSSPRNTIVIIGALACLAASQGDQALYETIAHRAVVIGGTPAVTPEQLDNLQQLYPLLATPDTASLGQAGATDPAPGTGKPLTLDQLFGKTPAVAKAEVKGKTTDVVDYFDALNQTKAKNIRLDGLAPGVGAVINGSFVALGDPVPSLEYPADASQKKLVAPRLTTITPAGITIREPNGSRTIVVTIRP